MQTKIEAIINGVTYETKSEMTGTCDGCVGMDETLCDKLLDQYDCSLNKVIWINKEPIKEVPKYTVEDVLQAIEHFGYVYFTESQTETINDYLAKQTNPDYQLYLKLKEQFKE